MVFLFGPTRYFSTKGHPYVFGREWFIQREKCLLYFYRRTRICRDFLALLLHHSYSFCINVADCRASCHFVLDISMVELFTKKKEKKKNERKERKYKKKNTAFMNLPFIFNPSFHLNEFFLQILNTHESKKGKEKNWNNSTKIILCLKSEIFRSIKG